MRQEEIPPAKLAYAFAMTDFGARTYDFGDFGPPCGEKKVPRITKLGTYWLCPACDLSPAR